MRGGSLLDKEKKNRSPTGIYFPCTESQKRTIKSIAAKCGLGQGEYILKRALGYEPKTVLSDAFFDFHDKLCRMMDENKIAFSVGVELSFLDDERQYDVLNACEENDNTPSYAQAVRMHKAYGTGELTKNDIEAIMCEEKANQRETIKIPADSLRGKIPGGYSMKQQQEFIVKACDFYHRYLIRQRDAR